MIHFIYRNLKTAQLNISMFAFTECTNVENFPNVCSLYYVLAFQLHLLKSSFKCLKGMLHISNQHTSISRADRVCVSGSKNNTGQKENRRKTSSHIQTCKILEKVGKFDKYLPTIQEKIKEFQQARRSILALEQDLLHGFTYDPQMHDGNRKRINGLLPTMGLGICYDFI